MKVNGSHQLLVHADDVNILGGSVYTVTKSIEAFVFSRKESGLYVTAGKTQYMVMSEIRMQDEVRISGLIIVPSKGWKSSNILLSTLFSNTLSLHSSLNMRNQISHPYKTRGKIIVLYILNFIFCIANWKTKDSAMNDRKHS